MLLLSVILLSSHLSQPVGANPGRGVLFGTDASGGNLISIDPASGASTIVGNMGVGAVPSLAADPTTGIMYAGGGGGSPFLYTVDTSTGAATFVGDTGLGLAAIGGMDFMSDGTLFAAVNIAGDGGTGSDHLATIDKATGVATVIGSFGTCTGVSIPSTGGGSCTLEGMEAIAFNLSDTLYGATSSLRGTQTPALYTIDATTGSATPVGPIVDGSGTAPSGGVVSLQFACDGDLVGGTATAVSPATDGGDLIVMSHPPTGSFGTLAKVTSGTSLGALAFETICHPPVADDQTVETDEDTPVVITLTGSDVDGDSLTFSIVGGPAHGTLGAITPAGPTSADVTYTPNLNYNGPDSFTFKARDVSLDSNTATVNITVRPVNDPPVANDDTASTNEDTPVNISVLVNDSDVDGDTLTVLSVTTPAHGTAVINPDKTVKYTPNLNFNGADSFDYTVSDGKGGTDIATVSITTINPVNDPPVADAGSDKKVIEESLASLDGRGSSDLDGDKLSFSWTQTGGPRVALSNANSPTPTFPAPPADGATVLTFKLVVSDGTVSRSDTVTVTVINRTLDNCTLGVQPDDPIAMNTVRSGQIAKTIHAEKQIFDCALEQGSIPVRVDLTIIAEIYENMVTQTVINKQAQVMTCIKEPTRGDLIGCSNEVPLADIVPVRNCSEEIVRHPQEMNSLNKGVIVKTIDAQKEVFLCDIDNNTATGSPAPNEKKVDLTLFTEIWEDLNRLNNHLNPVVKKTFESFRCIINLETATVESCKFLTIPG